MLQALDHVVVQVADLPTAVRQYAALLGRSPWWQALACTRFRLENTTLELVEGEGPEGIAALAFATDDAEACATALRERGVPAAEPAVGIDRDEPSGGWRRWRRVELDRDATRGLRVMAIEALDPEPVHEPVPADAVARLDHVVVSSPDLDAAIAFYGEKLGLRLALDRSFPERGLRILFFRVGGTTVEVVSGPADGYGGLAWQVGDADAARARLAAADFDVSEVRDGFKPGTRVCTVRSRTCGVPTLMIEPAR